MDLKRKGKTVIVSSHDPVFLDFSETIFLLKDGTLVDTKIIPPPLAPACGRQEGGKGGI
jgi:ABC-type siderophore export system fused ATPase/permease subunit